MISILRQLWEAAGYPWSVRLLLGWQRYDSRRAVAAMSRLYAQDLRVMMNWVKPSVKLDRKERGGSRNRRAREIYMVGAPRYEIFP